MILDTNGLSALAEGDSGLESVLRRASRLAIPVIVIGEYRYGISQSRHRTDYEEWLAEYLPRSRILGVDERTTVYYSVVRSELRKAGTPIPSNDVWISALCRRHCLPLVSRDRRFDAVSGVTRIGW